MAQTKVIQTYDFEADEVPIRVKIVRDPKEYVLIYNTEIPQLGNVTKVIMEDLQEQVTKVLPVQAELRETAKEQFMDKAKAMIKQSMPKLNPTEINILAGLLYHNMLGLGNLEVLLKDDDLEEVAILNANEAIWVYHRKYGWMKTNLSIDDENQIQNFASIVARKVGRRITTLNPLLDAHLETGDRVNATLGPITTKGNTLTIRKMRRKPWLVNELIANKTVSSDVMALIWMGMQYELSMLVAGGTASGKTTFLNMMMPFIQPNHRVISIEDTRELALPKFLHWIPCVTRLPNPEGKGEISMLDLLINSLRMRPDRMIVGEVRRRPEAEVLFEAMHTGHSVYATIHADTAEQAIRRLTTPPIELPETEIEALPLIIVCFRQRRIGIRRVLQVAELIPGVQMGGETKLKINNLYKWRPRSDEIVKIERSVRFYGQLQEYTGLTENEVNDELQEKKQVLDYLARMKLQNLDQIGGLMSLYYWDRDTLLKAVEQNTKPEEIL